MSSGLFFTSVLIQGITAAVLLGVGVWGRSMASDLAPRHMSSEEREHRIAVMRRGSMACLVVGWIIAASVVWVIADRLTP